MSPDSISLGQLHAHLLRQMIATGRAPTAANMASDWALAESSVRARLRELQAHHGVVLHPHSDEVWVIHPFSGAPTLFSLHAGDMTWWTNCAWCSLGAALLIACDCRITSYLGGYGERVDLVVRDGELMPSDLLVHFPIPMSQVWDNVLFACSTILLFARESDIDHWASRHGLPRGDSRRVVDLWPFARDWYGGHLSETWQKTTLAEAQEMFERHGLDGPIWELPAGDGRF